MRMLARLSALALLGVVATACNQSPAPTPNTGLTGVVLRGPITNTCESDKPCSLPFSAAFNVYENTRRVTGFRSDANGRFTVILAAGTYRIIPDGDAPIIRPSQQVQTVDVLSVGLTQVTLEFDTGIR